MAEEPATSAKPKKHSPFMQVVFRKSGEAMDLGGKAMLGFSGLGHLLSAPHLSTDGGRIGVEVAVGGALLLAGIYLQAKAEETT